MIDQLSFFIFCKSNISLICHIDITMFIDRAVNIRHSIRSDKRKPLNASHFISYLFLFENVKRGNFKHFGIYWNRFLHSCEVSRSLGAGQRRYLHSSSINPFWSVYSCCSFLLKANGNIKPFPSAIKDADVT